MAKGLTKLKSVLKRWQSIGRANNPAAPLGRSCAAAAVSASPSEVDHHVVGLQAVYVGKSRRRYLVRPDVIDHPLVRELVVQRSGPDDDDEDAPTVVGCEVVLFEHLLWMLDNADAPPHPDSLQELVEFYTC
ncbi:hypothetical protein Scep_025031 [Stephania cephalantha]|uniref:Small auxin up regulated protein n=1 Tax=Stephania cephalantha TaxID=152367 RepID=A0AAP0EXM1_9MAGN